MKLRSLLDNWHMCPGGRRGLAALLLNTNGRITTRQKKMTNWEKHHLTFPERRYAATDAWIALELFTVVTTCRKQQEQNVPTLPENYSIQASLQARKR
jgi:ribonuclease D